MLAPESSSQSAALAMKEEPVMKKIKLSSHAAAKRIEYSDTDDNAESPVDDSEDDDDDREMKHQRRNYRLWRW